MGYFVGALLIFVGCFALIIIFACGLGSKLLYRNYPTVAHVTENALNAWSSASNYNAFRTTSHRSSCVWCCVWVPSRINYSESHSYASMPFVIRFHCIGNTLLRIQLHFRTKWWNELLCDGNFSANGWLKLRATRFASDNSSCFAFSTILNQYFPAPNGRMCSSNNVNRNLYVRKVLRHTCTHRIGEHENGIMIASGKQRCKWNSNEDVVQGIVLLCCVSVPDVHATSRRCTMACIRW